MRKFLLNQKKNYLAKGPLRSYKSPIHRQQLTSILMHNIKVGNILIGKIYVSQPTTDRRKNLIVLINCFD